MKSLLLVFPLFFFACGSSTSPANDSASADSLSIATQQAMKKDSLNNPDNTLPDPDNDKGYKLMETEMVGKIKLGLDGKTTLAEMGAPEKKSAATEWGADGLYHQDWNYESKGIDLNMSGEDSLKMEIWSLRFYAPCPLRTLRNIGIGNTFEEVKEAYKEELDDSFSSDQTLVAGTVYGGMIFNFENGKLSSVFIGSAAE